MGTEPNNLHISEPLLQKLSIVAREEHTSVESLVQDLLANALDKREIEQLFSSMQEHARSQGLTEADVETAIAEYRKSNSACLP